MKYWKTVLAAAGVSCMTVAVSAVALQMRPRTPDREEQQKRRAEFRQKSLSRMESPVVKVKGGTDGNKPLYGITLNDDDLYSYGNLQDYCGPVEISASENYVKLAPSKSIKASSGCYYDGTVVAIYRDFNARTPMGTTGIVTYSFFDAETWESVGMGTASYTFDSDNVYPTDITYDPTTKRLYGCFVQNTGAGWSTGSNFGYLDLTKEFENWTSPVQIISNFGQPMTAITSSSEGTLYGIGTDNKLYTINKISGALTEIGEIDFTYEPVAWGYACAEMDWETGDIYFYYQDSEWDTYIVKIDSATAHSTIVADYSYTDHGTGSTDNFPVLFFRQNVTQNASTPSKVTDLAVSPDGVGNAANISFTMPLADTDGEPLSGTIDWKVSVSADVVASGQAASGDLVETHVTVPSGGLTTFVVYAQSGDNEGTPTAVTVFIGNDTPMLPSNPLVSTNGKDVQIVWDQAVGVHSEQGGNLADVTYRVLRLPDNKVVAEASTGLSATDNIESVYKTRYSYSVTPVSGEIEGEARSTRPFYAGEVFALPHSEDFSDELRFNQYPAIDANHDGNTWWIDTSRHRAVYSSGSVKADDYLCIGPFDMKAGSKYSVTMDANGHSNPEAVSVWAGADRTDGSTYTHEVVPTTILRPSMGESHLAGSFIPTENGQYYFGVRAESDAYMQNIYLYNIQVSEIGDACPAAPTGLTATPCDGGMRLVCTLPALTLGGDKAEINSVRITRDNDVIAEVTDGVADGAAFTWTDTGEVSDGEHRYGVMASNDAGPGESAECLAWWGLDRPGRPCNMRVYEDIDKAGLIHVTWDAPAAGIHGGRIDPAGIDWVIDWLSLGSAGSGMRHVGSDCHFDLQLAPEQCAVQDLIAFSVYGINPAGTSDMDGKLTRSGYFGPALPLPIRESWTGFRHQSGIWSGESLKENEELFESYWDMWDGQDTGVRPQDDDCMNALTTTVQGGGYRLRSPRIAISDETNPTLVFYLLYTSDAQDFEVEIGVDDQPMATLRKIEIDPAEYGLWKRIEIPLEAYKDARYIQFGFKGHGVNPATGFCCIDNLSVLDLKASDMTAISMSGPRKAAYNEPVELTVTFRNSGSSAVESDDYVVRLVKNGRTVAEKPGPALGPDANAEVLFTDYPTPADPQENEYSAEIVFADDENPSDNGGISVSVRVEPSVFPTVNDLSGNTANGVTLLWSEPSDADILPEYGVEDFESYTAFTTTDLGNWKTYDGDGLPTVVLSTAMGVLNYPEIGTPMAWQVIDPLEANIFMSSWYPRSGNQMLVSFQACNAGNDREATSDDWLISPELYGGAQNISFYACSGMGGQYAPEIIDIMYSTTGTDIEDFVALAENVEVPYDGVDWTEMTFGLPDGARYFAIVHKSYNKVALMIDDVKYIAKGNERRPLTLLGYNIYRDGQRINAEPVGETVYTDENVVDGTSYVYHVSVVWDRGESGLSNEYNATAGNSVRGIEGYDILISTSRGTIRVSGAEGQPVDIYTTSGIRVASTRAAANVEEFGVESGIYIVRTPAGSAKVRVN